MTTATAGKMMIDTSVSFQLSQNRSPSVPAIVKALRTEVVIADEVAAASWYASNANLEISRHDDWGAEYGCGSDKSRSIIARRRSNTTRWPVHAIPYSDMNEPRPRSRKTATTASSNCTHIHLTAV